MSSIIYEVENNSGSFVRHSFDYQFCKSKYLEYTNMNTKEFRSCLLDSSKLGEIGHLCCFVLRMKQDKVQMMYSLEDYGIIHQLFHCMEFGEEWIRKNSKEIHKLFKKQIKLA